MATTDRSTRPLAAALTRPVHLVVPGAGLLFALAGAGWWLFPLAVLLYAVTVVVALRGGTRPGALAPEVTHLELRAILDRIAASVSRLETQVAEAAPALRSALEISLEQVRAAATVGAALARKAQQIEDALAGIDPTKARAEAEQRRRWAAWAQAGSGRQEYLDGAAALDESAGHADALATLGRRTYAQLDHLAVTLENAAVRAVRIRVASDDDEGTRAVSDALRVDVETLRETLAMLEGPDLPTEAQGGSATAGESRMRR